MIYKRQTNPVSSAVVAFASKAEIDPRQLGRKLIFNVIVIFGAIAVVVLDLWVVSQGLVTTDPQKKFAAFIALGAGALLLVALLSLSALLSSTFSYQRLKLLMKDAEKDEVVEEEAALIDAIAGALQQTGEPTRTAVVNALMQQEPLQRHPTLVEELENLSPARPASA